MNRMWGLAPTFLFGVAYGFVALGRQVKSHLLLRGVLIGLAWAILLAMLRSLQGLWLPGGFVGFLAATMILCSLFVFGVWIGDFVQDRTRRSEGRRLRRLSSGAGGRRT